MSLTNVDIPLLGRNTEGCIEQPLEIIVSDHPLIHENDNKFHKKSQFGRVFRQIYVLMFSVRKVS